MELPSLHNTGHGDAVAITSIFEHATEYPLTPVQRERVRSVVMKLGRTASVMDFVSLAERIPDLCEFSSAVRDCFANDVKPSTVDGV